MFQIHFNILCTSAVKLYYTKNKQFIFMYSHVPYCIEAKKLAIW